MSYRHVGARLPVAVTDGERGIGEAITGERVTPSIGHASLFVEGRHRCCGVGRVEWSSK